MVLLGFLDEPKSTKSNGNDDDPNNWTISRIGGDPAFPNGKIATELKTNLTCSKCNNQKTFVCQLYCPLEGHPYDRAIYLFACRNSSCWNSSSSWTAVRCQNYDETVEMKQIEPEENEEGSPATVPNSSTDWCDDANAWGSDEELETREKPSSTTKSKTKTISKDFQPEAMLTAMKIEENEDSTDDDEDEGEDEDDDELDVDVKPKKTNKTIPVASADAFKEWKKRNLQSNDVDVSSEKNFPFYYIEIDDEELIIDEAKAKEKKKSKNQISKFETIDEDEDGPGRNQKEKYEKTREIEHGDVVFYRFQQKIRYAPEQIIRYDWSGEPLIITKIANDGFSSVSKCRHCQSKSHFEFQLMPSLVNFMKIDERISLEFGTVFVFTCSKNCWNQNEDLYRFENVFVQADPDQNLFD